MAKWYYVYPRPRGEPELCHSVPNPHNHPWFGGEVLHARCLHGVSSAIGCDRKRWSNPRPVTRPFLGSLPPQRSVSGSPACPVLSRRLEPRWRSTRGSHGELRHAAIVVVPYPLRPPCSDSEVQAELRAAQRRELAVVGGAGAGDQVAFSAVCRHPAPLWPCA